ncbi:hypothetical protein BU23DRAFT_256930 [Bimuria novae-zelandiae CBS 107.79]|uniref:C3H1-type domain-containing protein n=1 Tax=Bimuria novae-zelandiae CBS 107.79 TaxID=1447943 RepID=A0A6A5UVL2_9PLEO|nr:hypothetical protein BU23DRAFT_256930 [Bimuria novae-zelandiae CBS 107.79]
METYMLTLTPNCNSHIGVAHKPPPQKPSSFNASQLTFLTIRFPATNPSIRASVCIKCFRNHLRCDAGEPYTNCAQRNRNCKRSNCANFKAGTCHNSKCTRAHENDLAIYKLAIQSKRIELP